MTWLDHASPPSFALPLALAVVRVGAAQVGAVAVVAIVVVEAGLVRAAAGREPAVCVVISVRLSVAVRAQVPLAAAASEPVAPRVRVRVHGVAGAAAAAVMRPGDALGADDAELVVHGAPVVLRAWHPDVHAAWARVAIGGAADVRAADLCKVEGNWGSWLGELRGFGRGTLDGAANATYS